MYELTPRQYQVLDLIRNAIEENGMPPTRAEIALGLGFKSPNAAEDHLRALERKGAIELIPGASRGIRLKDAIREQMGLPLVGRVAAGQPILAQEHIEARYDLDPDLFHPKPHYLLQVHGMSMRDAGILDGDLAIVRKQSTARSGEIVVALMGDEATVKTLRRTGRGVSGRRIELHPANPGYAPIVPDPDEFLLLGKVIEIRRTLA